MERVRSRRKWKQKRLTAIAVNNELTKCQREAILDVLELIDFNVSTETDKLVKVLPILQDYITRGEILIELGNKRTLEHEIGL